MNKITIQRYLLLLCAVAAAGRPTPSSDSYQYVKFIGKTPEGKSSGTSYFISEARKSGTRTARSFFFPYELYYGQFSDIWASDLSLHQHQQSLFDFGHENSHFTPDFSDGLSYPDPYLLTGVDAKLAVAYLYRKELFFGDIPHVKAVLRNQQLRRENGLVVNKLGSLRPVWPYHREAQRRQFFS